MKINKPQDKEKDVIRLIVPSEIKKKFNEIMTDKGTTASDYLRQYIIETINQNNSKIPNIKNTLDKILHPEIDLDKRVSQLERKIEILENILKDNDLL